MADGKTKINLTECKQGLFIFNLLSVSSQIQF
jgi:hypothetical protein